MNITLLIILLALLDALLFWYSLHLDRRIRRKLGVYINL